MKNSLSFVLKASLLVYVGVLILLTVNVFHLKQTKTKHETTNKIARNESPVCKNVTIKPEANINEILRFGPGENGQAVKIGPLNLSIPELVALDKKHRFTTFISDMVGIRRRLPDKRPAACLTKKYPDDLPPVGIVIIFRDELASIVLRTVYSVLQMSPPKLIKEIILVDDGSKDELLRLAVAIHAEALEKVRIVRNEVPKGLMMARQAGVDALTADYVIIMDGHMEVVPGWLEPLIFRLVQEPRALLCSHVGQVDDKDFQFRIGDGDIQVFPFFDPLNLNQMFAPYRKEFLLQRNGSVDPLPAGTVQGMMIVMKTDFFLALGGFDPGMQVWGSEQIELSVKVWMCGGRVEMIPCSMVGHMYR